MIISSVQADTMMDNLAKLSCKYLADKVNTNNETELEQFTAWLNSFTKEQFMIVCKVLNIQEVFKE